MFVIITFQYDTYLLYYKKHAAKLARFQLIHTFNLETFRFLNIRLAFHFASNRFVTRFSLGTHIFWNNESNHKINESQDPVLNFLNTRTIYVHKAQYK